MSAFVIAVNGNVTLEKELRKVTTQAPEVVARVLNAAAHEIRRDTIATIVSQVKLDEHYVASRIHVSKDASAKSLVARISADKRGTNLARYNMHQQSVKNAWDEAKYSALFGSKHARVPIRNKNGSVYTPEFTPRKGDIRRGIGKGKKASGVTVLVKRQATMRHVFSIPTMRPGQNGNKFILVQRVKGTRRLKSLFGPSADQMVISIWDKGKANYMESIETQILSQVI